MREAVVVSTARTGICRAFRGSLNNIKSPTLLGHAIEHAVARAGVEGAEIEDTVIGCCLAAGTSSMNVARLGTVAAGLPTEVSARRTARMRAGSPRRRSFSLTQA